MSVFNLKIENPRSIPQETQQKTFKFVKSSKGQINFRAPPRYFNDDFDPAEFMLYVVWAPIQLSMATTII